MTIRTRFILFLAFTVISCAKDDPTIPDIDTPPVNDDPELTAIESTFGGKIDLDNLYNYAEQAVPTYITKDNTRGNRISNLEATFGRVLFYDKKLSLTNTVACASCHQQQLAFGDNEALSSGIKAFQRLARGFQRGAERIVNYAKHKLTSGRIEGFNSLISKLFIKARGVKDLEYMELRLRYASIMRI